MNIYFFGDSISFGQGISVERAWVSRIGYEFRQDFPEKELLIQNASVNGNTTRMSLERMPYDIQSHKVDVLVVGFGMNDCNYWETDHGLPRVSPAAFEANMHEIIDRGFHFGAKEIIIHTNHPSPRTDIMTATNITYGESNHYYNKIIKKIAAEEQRTRFIDIEEICLKRAEKEGRSIADLVLPDGVHLSLLGHQYYFDAIYPEIKRIAEDGTK